jgi:hypothetical protein
MANLFKGIGHLLFGTPVAPPVPPPVVTREDASAAAQRQIDELARRRGSAADILTGSAGAEPGAGQVGRLIVGN